MDYSEYYSARDKITQIVRDDLLGPVKEDEIIYESPVSYYLVGKLYPKNIKSIIDEDIEIENEELFHDDDAIALGNSGYPSAMGFTFALTKETTNFEIELESAYYELQEKQDASRMAWKRNVIKGNYNINIEELRKKKIIIEQLHKEFFLHINIYDNANISNYKITVTLVNNNTSSAPTYTELSKNTYFQPNLVVKNIVNGKFSELYKRYSNLNDIETQELELLYHDVKTYAVGHGCATHYNEGNDSNIESIELSIMPEHAVLQMKPTNCISGNLLSMKYLSEAPLGEVLSGINKLCDGYKNWIDNLKKDISSIDINLQNCANNNINKCSSVLARLRASKTILKNELAFRAFQFANEAMYLQRKATSANTSDSQITWYPFQLAFFLMELEPFVLPDSKNREIVDLLWFPTGGGKTEAYLGISAFAIFYRRLLALKNKKEDIGVVSFMRYTLRLLSFQQFERASAMICASEVIRRKNKLGDNPFGIGLWAGSSLTPNKLKEAEEYLRGKTFDYANPVQVKKCPWCGTVINQNDYYVDNSQQRMFICCPNEKCDFHDGLPIHLIDEDIYANRPSFIVGTIDKFAQIAFKDEAGALLGIGVDNPPDLIIQDELHLISGALGTITGLYEAAITRICEKNNIKPKIIASTATIRNAENQIKALYAKSYMQFPAQGLSVNDSYFAKLSLRDEKAERDYVGIFSAGSTRALNFTRTTAALLFATRYLVDLGYSEEVIDSFWTQTGYFNTLKELGSALIRIVDSVQDRFQYLKESKFAEKYPFKSKVKRFSKTYEMTSRHSSADLGNAIQNELIRSYKKDGSNEPYDFLIASNMISVGVDVPRLNTMVVVGQPIKTSEYIQATSRVGRKTPGLVYVIYQPVFSRDRSHYEQFEQYHSSLYKYVEATSLTPFADRARDRALQALYIILCRYLVPELRKNEDAKNFNSNLSGLDTVRNYIYDYVKIVDPDELDNVKKEISEIEIKWEEEIRNNKNLIYFKPFDDQNTLYKKDIRDNERIRMMNSMRSVEPTIEVQVRE